MGPNWGYGRFLIDGDYYQTNETEISWKIVVPKNLECNGIPCYNESMHQIRICNPVFLPAEENLLQLSFIDSELVWVRVENKFLKIEISQTKMFAKNRYLSLKNISIYFQHCLRYTSSSYGYG